jgi:hypothetical protein
MGNDPLIGLQPGTLLRSFRDPPAAHQANPGKRCLDVCAALHQHRSRQ